jgi:hypothetical protein
VIRTRIFRPGEWQNRTEADCGGCRRRIDDLSMGKKMPVLVKSTAARLIFDRRFALSAKAHP